MKKGKITMTITLGLMCFILVFVMFMQFRTVQETDITEIETMREAELREALAEWKTKYQETSETLQDTNQKIEDYSQKDSSNQQATELLSKEVEQTNMILGKVDVQGEGVIVTLTDTEEESVTSLDLINLVNELILAGAEAISINDNRVINMTDIVDIGNQFIVINSQRISSPYTVKAIGEKTYLQSALTIKSGYVDRYRATGININVETKGNIKILKYEGDKFDLKYVN